MKALIFCFILTCSLGVTVQGVVTAEVDGYYVVALNTSPVYLKSDGDNLLADYSAKYSAMRKDSVVVVTRDSDIYYGLKYAEERGDVEATQRYAEKAVERYLLRIENTA